MTTQKLFKNIFEKNKITPSFFASYIIKTENEGVISIMSKLLKAVMTSHAKANTLSVARSVGILQRVLSIVATAKVKNISRNKNKKSRSP